MGRTLRPHLQLRPRGHNRRPAMPGCTHEIPTMARILPWFLNGATKTLTTTVTTPTTFLQLPPLLSPLSTAPLTQPPAPPCPRWTRVLLHLSYPHRAGTRLVITKQQIMALLLKPPSTTMNPLPMPHTITPMRGPAPLPPRQETSSLPFEALRQASLTPFLDIQQQQ